MGPEELQLLEFLMSNGLSIEEAVAMLPQMQQSMAGPSGGGERGFTNTPFYTDGLNPDQYGSAIYDGSTAWGDEMMPPSGMQNPGIGDMYARPGQLREPMSSNMGTANAVGGTGGWVNSVSGRAETGGPMQWEDGSQRFYKTANPMQMQRADQMGDAGAGMRDVGAMIRQMLAGGRNSQPRTAVEPLRGKSAFAPGQMKQAAGVQSARQFTPAGPKTAARPVTPRPSPKPVSTPASRPKTFASKPSAASNAAALARARRK